MGFVRKTCSPLTVRCKGGRERTGWTDAGSTGDAVPVLGGHADGPPPLCTFPNPSTRPLGDGNTF